MAKCLCRACDQSFTSVTSFDMHRVGGYGEPIYKPSSTGKSQQVIGHTKSNRRCLTEQEMQDKGMVKTTKGLWATGTFEFNRSTDTEQEEDELEEE